MIFSNMLPHVTNSLAGTPMPAIPVVVPFIPRIPFKAILMIVPVDRRAALSYIPMPALRGAFLLPETYPSLPSRFMARLPIEVKTVDWIAWVRVGIGIAALDGIHRCEQGCLRVVDPDAHKSEASATNGPLLAAEPSIVNDACFDGSA
jgi:hypothetical protein